MRLALTPINAAILGGARVGGSPSLDAQIAAIYAAGWLGPWLDVSDLSTMYTTRAGMVPVGTPGNGTAHFVGRILDKSGGGYHALAANDTTARPQLSARVNLLTYSEDFSNAAWNKTRSSASANATTAPNGTLTADKIIEDSSASNSHQATQAATLVAGEHVLSAWVKASERTWVRLANASLANGGCWFNLSNGTKGTQQANVVGEISSTGDGWCLCSITFTASAGSNVVGAYIASADAISNYTGDGTSGLFVWGTDLRPTNIHAAGSIPAYQRVGAAEDYDSVGFPYRLIPNGTGQALQTSTITPGTDSVTVGVGVRKLSDGSSGTYYPVFETSANPSTNNGSMGVFGPATSPGGLAEFAFASRGTTSAVASSLSYPAPITANVVGLGRISTDLAILRVNGSQAASSSTDQGAGNYLAYVMNLFSRNGATLFFGGQWFGQITLFGPQLTAGELATVEAWINSKTKAY